MFRQGQAVSPQELYQKIDTKVIANDFFIECEKTPLHVVLNSMSLHFNKNILAYEDCKDRLVSLSLDGNDIEELLNSVSWQLGLEWTKRGEVYYIGGNSDVVQIFPSLGLATTVESVFKNVKIVNDKIIVQGTELEVKRVSDSLVNIIERPFVRAKLKIIELVYDNDFEFGFDWEKSFEYGFNWENMVTNIHPVTHAAMSLEAAATFNQVVVSSRCVVDTEISIMSGSDLTFEVGEETDREVYSTSDYGYSVVSGYSTQKTGLLLSLKAYSSGNTWVFDSVVENSTAITDLKKNVSKISNQLKTTVGKKYLITNFKSQTFEHEIDEGIPFLCRLPVIGFLFGVHKKVDLVRNFYIVIDVLESEALPVPDAPKFKSSTYDFKNILKDILGEFKEK